MACRWRIRHKLMLGLGLVIGIMGLLLAGTLNGLALYRATTKSIDSKLAELKAAEELASALHLRVDSQTDSNDQPRELEKKIDNAKQKLAAYVEKLADTLTHRRDPERGQDEIALIQALEERFKTLQKAVDQAAKPTVSSANVPLMNDPEVERALGELDGAGQQLHETIYDALYKRISEAKDHYRNSLIIVLATGVAGVLLTMSLGRFFYRWVFYPIRDLQAGVGRVAEGDFEHRIAVHSGDEMEELAAAFNDMTGRLREMYRDLARQVNERSRQLVRSERLAGVGFLAAGVAHEINNPLASIAFCSEALERRLFPNDERKSGQSDVYPPSFLLLQSDRDVITKYLKMIQQEAFRCKAITQRLLEFSRGGERRREPADLAELIQSVIEMVQHLQTSKGKRIVFEPSGGRVAWVNAQEIKSVVLNLVVNALDSMDDGGTLTITLDQRDRMAEMRFADTGCGMSPEILENIFEPFFTRSRTGKGTGLGLSISHRIITQHGGEIEAASPGLTEGSTFIVRIPLQPAEPVREEAHALAA